MTPIDEKVKEAWRGAQEIRRACSDAHVVRLADTVLYERAMRRKAEEWIGHHRCADNLDWSPGSHCCNDLRHDWTDADWIEQAAQELNETLKNSHQ